MKSRSTQTHRGRMAAAVLGMAALAGCATTPPPFQAEVTTLADSPAAVPATPRFRFIEPEPERAGSLAWRAERDVIRSGLERVGMRQAMGAELPPDLLVAFHYRTESFEGWTEVAVPVPLGYTMLWGPINDGIWGGGIMAQPMYQYQAVPTPAWRHVLEISLRRPQQPSVEVYHTRAVHESRSDDRLAVLPWLVEAALEDYPQGGNRSRIVSIPRPMR